MSNEEIRKMIKDILTRLSVDFDEVGVIGSEEHPVFMIKTEESNLLIGNRGQNLSALQFIVRRIVERRKEGCGRNFSVDINDYQKGRLEALKKEALRQAEKSRFFRHDVELSPMNSYERMIIHSLFSKDREINTYSAGSGQYRHVVLCYLG